MEIHPSFLNELCLARMGWQPESIEELREPGIVNRVFKIQLGETYVLRCREGRDAYREYRKEYFCMERARQAGIPGAWTVSLGLYQNIAYMLQDFIPGVNGSRCPDQSERIWRKLGEYAKRLHRIPTRGYGLDMTENGLFVNGFSPTLLQHIRYNMDSLTPGDPLIRLGIYPGQAAGHVKGLFAWLLTADLTLGLVHGDLSAKNTILGDDGTVYLIDYGCAFRGVVPYDEIISINGHTATERSVFLKSCGFDRGNPQEIGRLTVLSALSAFDKARWALDHNPPDIQSYLDRAAEQYQSLISISG